MLRLVLTLILPVVLAAPALAQPVLPPVTGGYDSQLGGAYPPPAGTVSVSRDRSEAPAPGLYNICYVNAFQTQPDETGWWRQHHPDLLLTRNGALVEDPNWPGEILLDTRTAAKRAALMAIIGPWIVACARDGFQAVEADNLDTFSRSGGLLTAEDNLGLAALMAAEAHRHGLAFGQKNAVELGARGRAAGFDFAITESCQVYDECSAYGAIYGRHVLEIEYTDTPRAAFDAACADRARRGPVVLRDRALAPRGAPGHHHEICPV